MIYFRADSNSQIASGHVMRCLSIARKFKEKGYDAAFLAADDNPAGMIRDAGFPCTVLHTQWDDLDGEMDKVQRILADSDAQLLVIDTYSVTRKYAESMRRVIKVCYLGSKREPLGDLTALINYSTKIDRDFYAQSYNPSITCLMLGPQYAPLRKEFQNIEHVLDMAIKRVLITTGGSDSLGITDKLLTGIASFGSFGEMTFDVVIGRMFQDVGKLYKKFGEHHNITFHENVTTMSELMSSCDLAISANGTTVYEIAAANVPALTFCISQEQESSAKGMADLGIVDYCGEMHSDGENTVKRILERLTFYRSHPEARLSLAKRAREVIDGNGCGRIVENLIKLL